MNHQCIADELQQQIDSGLIQGGVVCTSFNEEPVALGMQTENIPMSADSRFDIASVGKVFTASCTALLYLQGKIDIDAPFTEYLPEHKLGKNCSITIRDLAAHASGFDNSKPYCSADQKEFMQKICEWMPANPRRTSFIYSCGNYALLGKILNKVTSLDLNALADKLLWQPLGMTHTTWNAPGAGPFEVLHHHPTRPCGEHNDETCFQAGIPLGNGSVFSTAKDMYLYLKDIIERKHFPAAYYDLIEKAEFTHDGHCRSFGWDMSPGGCPAGLSEKTIHHTGWTGQSIFADPQTGFCGAILTSRLGNWLEAKKSRMRVVERILQEHSH